MSILIVYHANCADGFASAYVAQQWVAQEEAKHEVTYLAMNYGEEDKLNANKFFDLVKDKNVIVLDFSFKRPTMEAIAKLAITFEVYDHHKTAQAECEGLPYCFFDMTQSGAMLAWKRFFPGLTPPVLIDYVQDRDLWQWKLPNSKAINAVVQTTEKNFEAYHYLRCALATHSGYEQILRKGQTIIEMNAGHVKNAVKYPIKMMIGGYADILVINNPNLISESCETLAEDQPFAAAFFLKQDGKWQFSLRSRPPRGIDVSAIAKRYGGGGHAAAAGFELPFDQLGSLIQCDGSSFKKE